MKKINSELKLTNDESFKVIIGTTNKKISDSLYIEIGSYIKPTTKDNYKQQIENIYKKTKRFIITKLSKNNIYATNFIFVDNIATDRMIQGKRSYYEVQLFLKNLNQQPFKLAAEECKKTIVNELVDFIKEALKEEEFECYKTKA